MRRENRFTLAAGRRIALVTLFALFASAAGATAYSTDHSDTWGNASAIGWGVLMQQQGDTTFAAMFVYDAQGKPTWFTAALTYTGPTTTGGTTWVGDLYQSTGPWFGTNPYNSALYNGGKVGTMTFYADYVESGRLAYTVNGIGVAKNIVRGLFRNDNYNGTFGGLYKITAGGCANSSYNGTDYVLTVFTISQTASTIGITAATSAATRVYSGSYGQAGQFGKSNGTHTWNNGETGSYAFCEMNVNFSDMRGRVSASNNRGCTIPGNFAAIRE